MDRYSVAIVYHALPSVLELLPETIRLEYVDDAQEQQQTLATRVPGRDAAGRDIFLLIYGLAFRLYALHGCRVRDQTLSVYRLCPFNLDPEILPGFGSRSIESSSLGLPFVILTIALTGFRQFPGFVLLALGVI